jgi:Leucine-rich repeat (LRR) protein
VALAVLSRQHQKETGMRGAIFMRRSIFICLYLVIFVLPLHAQDNPAYAEAERMIEENRIRGSTELSLSGQEITVLPESIGNLTHLKFLYVAGNHLAVLPESIGQLKELRVLSLDGNQLTELPVSITQLPHLQHLILGGNNLTELPDSLAQLTTLELLSLTDNQLTALPDSIGQLTKLHTLSLSNNQLRELPPSLGNLTKLKNLDVDRNPLMFPPPEIVSQGDAAILSYLRDYEQIRARQVIAMGAGGIGLIAGFILLLRWRFYRGTAKKKRA